VRKAVSGMTLSLALAASIAGFAASSASAASAAEAGDDAIHDQLRALKTTMERALNERDVATLLDNVDPDVVFSTMNGDEVHGREGVRAYFAKMLDGPGKVVESVTTKFEPGGLSILRGGDTAIAYGTTDDHYRLVGGKSFDIQARWTSTMVLADGRWRVASFHYSANVFDNPILTAQRRLILGVAAAVAAVAALAGFWLGRRPKRTASPR
jgi:uncharacterized protein (TIGR02246 family)